MDNLANYQKIHEKIRKSGVPVIAGLEVTYSCNLSCKHCYVADDYSRELDLEEYCGLIDDLYNMGTFCLVFTGGEPLLRKDLFDIAGHAKAKGFLTILFTNGTLIDEDIADKIKQIGFWKTEISIYGATPETHDRITQKQGSFEKTLSGVKALCKRGVDVRLKTLLLSMNIHEYSFMKKLARELGLNFRSDFQINPKLDGSLTPLNYKISSEKILEVIKARDGLKYFPCHAHETMNNLGCNAGKHMLSISPSGEVKPCIIFPVSCGNIREQNIKEIWSEGNGILKKLRALKLADLTECSECTYRTYCIRCHATSYLQTGNMLNPIPASCEAAQLRYKLASERSIKPC